MTLPLLTGPEYSPRANARVTRLVVLLHGLGADGDDLIGLAPALAQHLPGAHFIAPHAPFPCDMAPQGRQWFSLADWSRLSMQHLAMQQLAMQQGAMQQGVVQAAPALEAFLAASLKRFSLSNAQLALVGFSQGTMMALQIALGRSVALAGVVGFSGMLVTQHIVSRPPVCLIHGVSDMVVPFGAMAMAGTFLTLQGVAVETHARPGLAHGIDPEGIAIAGAFLKKKLA